MKNSLTYGVHHIGLTVSNLEESAAFFTSLLEWEEVKRRNDYPAIFVSDGVIMLTLWATQSEKYNNFDRKLNVGLHHLALQVDSKEKLMKIYDKLFFHSVNIEFPPEIIREGPAMHMMCNDPSGVRIEFYWNGEH